MPSRIIIETLFPWHRIYNATVRWWEAAMHDPFIVTFDFGWGPPALVLAV